MSTSSSKESVRVSDHAVLRYLARATGLNVEIVREQILSSSNPAAFGAVCVRSEDDRQDAISRVVGPGLRGRGVARGGWEREEALNL
jgi:hypothetical protein